MKLSCTLLALWLLLPAGASAQPGELAGDLTGYTRFLVYPHLQKGRESMERGERDRALAEFERARALAPESTSVALHLAAAYSKFGEPARAESVLQQQLTRVPTDARLRTAMAALRLAQRAAAGPAAGAPCGTPGAAGCLPALPPPAPPPLPAPALTARAPRSGTAPTDARATSAQRAHAQPPPRLPAVAPVAPPPGVTGEELTGFTAALAARQFDDAEQYATALLDGGQTDVKLLDELTYKLMDAGASDAALRMLFNAYPFASGAAAERDTLFQRMAVLVEEQRITLGAGQLQLLRAPLDTPALRGRQAALWARLHECASTRAVLADMSPDYGHDDWMRLGDCSAVDAPALAQQAYARAQALQPGGSAARALAYQAHAANDHQTALDAWRSVPIGRLSLDDLLAAVTTALAAGQPEQAASWLGDFRDRGATPDYRYWSLVAETYSDTDTPAVMHALERAIELQPRSDDYVHLARLESDPGRQVRWLERAAALDGGNAYTHAALGFAYGRAGQPASALRAFERAAALDPANMTVQIELGYANWTGGLFAASARAFERAWHADPANLKLAQQLVYVYQRLNRNDAARSYVRQVLDAPASFKEAPAGAAGPEAAEERRFGFQRLHEDLGRRTTVNVDGFSGTAVGAGNQALVAGRQYRSYSQVEVDVRLGNPPIRDGSTLSAYLRVLADGGDRRSAVPSHNAMLGLGLRWKPLRERVIYLAAENQTALEGYRQQDVLLRASASFLNGGPYGDDWHPSGAGWFSRNLYLDAAQYLQTNRTAFTADYRTSYHRRVSAGGTLEPYAHLQFNGSRSGRIDRDLRAGVGLRWNAWHGANEYDAAPHKLSIGLEFQQALETYLSDRNGLFLSLGSRW